ncbi:hypothetical protein XF_2653 [Xylella fastidiosa 9a5c]|uniref:Uncharacterized protein n=1 Tax=Xylella fastidiosa (strain 9a5c) TaxID=160492 RepID=Q9PA67_XYLFA|nr:hypothetical protein XF_2653 [Xylella fastidiosa 9a5c]
MRRCLRRCRRFNGVIGGGWCAIRPFLFFSVSSHVMVMLFWCFLGWCAVAG